MTRERELLERHGFTEEDVKRWAEEKGLSHLYWPALVKLFLQEHGVRVPVSRRITATQKDIASLQSGETALIKVVVVGLASKREYIGCPNCFKKLDNAKPGDVVNCPYCDQSVTAAKFEWRSYLVADHSGEIVVTVPPRVMCGELHPMQEVEIVGTLNEFGEFMARDVSLPSERYVCEICGRELPSKEMYERHMREAHKVEPEKPKEEVKAEEAPSASSLSDEEAKALCRKMAIKSMATGKKLDEVISELVGQGHDQERLMQAVELGLAKGWVKLEDGRLVMK